MTRRLILLAGLIASAGQGARAPAVDLCLVREQLFLSPAGEPFRAPAAAPPPVASWFRGADGDGDGVLKRAEVAADAARFFATVDSDHDGEIVPDELARYEREIAPEISIYQPGAVGRERGSRKTIYGGPLGGGRYALTNIPDPIAAADVDMNRGTTRAELVGAAERVFTGLANGRPGLRLAELPPTPQAAMLADCAVRAAKARR